MAQKFWKVACDEKRNPGLWRKWYEEQCAAVGWPPPKFKLYGKSSDAKWTQARNCLKKVQPGDYVVVQLVGGQLPHRVGRVGTVVGKKVEDARWTPTVPKSIHPPGGEYGRRILVRWDLTLGPPTYNEVVSLPEKARFPLSIVQRPIAELSRLQFQAIIRAMSDEKNWGSMFSYFAKEKALSDYIAEFPYRIERGLKQYPDVGKITEKPLHDTKRSDVLLMDQKGNPVVVECKRGAATPESVIQLLGYISRVKKVTRKRLVRGILMHGGTRSLSKDVRRKLIGKGFIRVFQYLLNIDFAESR